MHKVQTHIRPTKLLKSNASTTARKIRVLAAGDLAQREFSSASNLLAQHADVTFIDGRELAAVSTRDYDLLLAIQTRPGSLNDEFCERVRHQNPLLGMVVVLGTWCEGEARTGKPLPHCDRVFWYQFPAWWQNNVAAWRERRPASWQQFPTESKAPSAPAVELGGLVVIDSPDAETAATLITVCESNGLGAIWTPQWRRLPMTSFPAAAIWVGGQLGNTECESLAELKKTLPENAPLVVLLDFPRIDRVSIARQLGATDVLGKPWRAEQLMACLNLVSASRR